jgi:hypothetical protein
MDMIFKDSSRMRLTNILYILRLGLNLLPGRIICIAGLSGRFTKLHIFFKKGTKRFIIVMIQEWLYMIIYMEQEYLDEALYGYRYHKTAFSRDIINRIQSITDKLADLEKEKYLLYYWCYNYLGPDKIRKLL